MLEFSAECPIDRYQEVLSGLFGVVVHMETIYGFNSHIVLEKITDDKRFIFRGKDAVIVHVDDIVRIVVS